MPDPVLQSDLAQQVLDARAAAQNPQSVMPPAALPAPPQSSESPADLNTGSTPNLPDPTAAGPMTNPTMNVGNSLVPNLTNTAPIAPVAAPVSGMAPPVNPMQLNPVHQAHANETATNQKPLLVQKADELDAWSNAQKTALETQAEKEKYQKQFDADNAALQAQTQADRSLATQSQDQIAAAIKTKVAAIKDIDPDRRSIPQRILGAIGMGFGAYGAAITHSKNFAMDLINESIKNDVDAQKANIEKQWKDIDTTHQLGNDQQLKYRYMVEGDRQNELHAREKLMDQLSYLQGKTSNAEMQAHIEGLKSGVQAGITNLNQQGTEARFSMLNQEKLERAAQAAAFQSQQRAAAQRLEDREDKFVEKQSTGKDARMTPEEARQLFQSQNGGKPYTRDPNAQTSGDPELKTFDSNGQPRYATNKEALAAKVKLDIPYQESTQAYQALLAVKNDPIAYKRQAETLKRSLQHLEGYIRAQSDNNGILSKLFGQAKGLDAEVPEAYSLESEKQLAALGQHIKAIGQATDTATFGPYKPQGQEVK